MKWVEEDKNESQAYECGRNSAHQDSEAYDSGRRHQRGVCHGPVSSDRLDKRDGTGGDCDAHADDECIDAVVHAFPAGMCLEVVLITDVGDHDVTYQKKGSEADTYDGKTGNGLRP